MLRLFMLTLFWGQGATGIPALICFGKTYLDFSNTFSTYCQKLSYVFYIIHFPVVVLCQYFISLSRVGCIYNFLLSLVISSLVTCSICYIIDKNKALGILFGLKKWQNTKEWMRLRNILTLFLYWKIYIMM